MSLHYRKITYDASEPAVNSAGDIWIKKIDDSYQGYMYINNIWIPIPSGGNYFDEGTTDIHYHNVYIQNIEPTTIKNGWFWIKTSTNQVYIYLNGFVAFAGA